MYQEKNWYSNISTKKSNMYFFMFSRSVIILKSTGTKSWILIKLVTRTGNLLRNGAWCTTNLIMQQAEDSCLSWKVYYIKGHFGEYKCGPDTYQGGAVYL